MYTDVEIVKIARHCKSAKEIGKAIKTFRYLILNGAQPSSLFLVDILSRRFNELV